MTEPKFVCAETQRAAEGLFADLGVRGVLMQMAKKGQILHLRCEMPTCLCPMGRKCFEVRSTPIHDWAPNPDHYPIPKSKGGHLTPDNVRLAHVKCNRYDVGLRRMVGAKLLQGDSLQKIADSLNKRKRAPSPWGTGEWNRDTVRRAFVS